MSKHSDWVLLAHMLDAGKRIREYLNGVSAQEFFARTMLQDAVIRQLEIMGEAANHLSPEFCSAHPDVPWRGIAGMRHRLIHAYFSVDLGIVWDTATRELPVLLQRLQTILAEHERHS